MVCKYSEQLESYADRILAGRDKSEFEAHLKDCGECREQLSFYDRLAESIHKDDFRASGDFTAKVMGKIKPARPKGRYVNLFVALAAVFLVVMTAVWFVPGWLPRRFTGAPRPPRVLRAMPEKNSVVSQVKDLKDTGNILMDGFFGYLKAPYKITVTDLNIDPAAKTNGRRSADGDAVEELQDIIEAFEKM